MSNHIFEFWDFGLVDFAKWSSVLSLRWSFFISQNFWHIEILFFFWKLRFFYEFVLEFSFHEIFDMLRFSLPPSNFSISLASLAVEFLTTDRIDRDISKEFLLTSSNFSRASLINSMGDLKQCVQSKNFNKVKQR